MNEESGRKEISIKLLNKIFKQNPFNLLNNELRMLLSRYLIEDNEEYMVQLDILKKEEVSRIKSIFKNILHKY